MSVKTEQEAEKRVREEVEVAIRREQEASQQALSESSSSEDTSISRTLTCLTNQDT